MATLDDNPFAKDGVFAENIRAGLPQDDTELRESMKKFGWVKQFPALTDEYGVVLVGHRRLQIANELGITPVVVKLNLGSGSDANAERLKIAIVSNLGHKPLTAADRKRIAEHLYSKPDWTMQRIANALNCSQATITTDLRDLSATDKSKHAKTASNPKGAGRRKGSTTKQKPAPKPHYKEAEIAALAESGKSYAEIAATTSVGKRQIRHIVERARIKRDAEAQIDRSELSMTAQQKFDAAVRQEKARLAASFHVSVQEAVKKFLMETTLPKHRAEQEQAKKIMNARRGIMDKATFNKIRRALHPDSRNSASDKVLAEAFDAFMALEKQLLNEKDSPTDFQHLPRTWQDWEAAKRKATEARKAKRAAAGNSVARK